MTLTVEINNPRLVMGLEEMATASGLEAQVLCEGLIERRVAQYIDEMEFRRREAVKAMMTDRLIRIVEGKSDEG